MIERALKLGAKTYDGPGDLEAGYHRSSSDALSVGPFVVGDHFGDNLYRVGFSSFRSPDPSLFG